MAINKSRTIDVKINADEAQKFVNELQQANAILEATLKQLNDALFKLADATKELNKAADKAKTRAQQYTRYDR